MKKFDFIKKHKNNSNKKYANKRNVHKKINAQKKVKKGNLKTKLSNIEIKPQFLIIGLVATITIISLIYFIFLKYSQIMNFKYEGYGISGKQITENLLGASGDKENRDSQKSNLSDNDGKNASLAKIEEQGTIFKKLNSYFIGNKEKTEIDLSYPIYINDKNTIYNLNQDITLISKNFEQVAGYPNISITDGKVYNGNSLERADSKEYIFAKTEEGIYINLKEIKISTTANEYVLPVNSLMVFEEDVIRYYSIKNNILIFNEIKDVDYNSQVIIKNIENNDLDTNGQNIQNEQNKENTNKVDKQYNYEELLTSLGVIENAKDTVEREEIIEEDTSDNKREDKAEKDENKPNAPQDPKPENNEQTNAEYVKPEVTVEDFKAEVYTAKSNLNIKDPKARIIEAPTFEIYKDGKIYLRRVFKNSGEIQITGLVPETEYEIIGKYIYLNAENKKVENTFYKGTIKTKGYEALGTIELSKEEGEIYSNKIQIKNVKIISDLQNEAIKGINQIELETGNIKTVLKNNKVNELLEGKEVTIESSEGLKSNIKIEYAIKFYDKNGKELKVKNNKGKTRTSKQEPKVTVKIKKQDIVSVTLGVKLTNKDNVKLENYKYIITRPNGEKLKEERLSEHEKEIKLEDLDQNQYYKIKVYADYDLGDNKGIQKDVEIGNLVFATKPISTLGSLEMIVENKELTSKNAKISYKIDEDKTDKRLIQILNELTIKIVENNDDNKEISKPSAEEQNSEKESQHTNRKTTKEGTVIYTNTLTKEEIERLQLGEIKEINYENLKSNTKYTIEITGNVQLGNTQENIQVTYNYKEFTTLKIPAKVEIKNQFVTGNLIDLDVRVEDEDKSVLNNKVRMELRDEKSNLIDLQEIETNKDWLRKTYEKLEENKTYKLSFYADQYNEGSTDETYKVNYLIKEIDIITEPGISGSVGLTELTKKATGKNLVDMSSEIKWYVYPNFYTNDYYGKEYNEETEILTLGGHGNYRRAVYDLREYAGQEVTMSFKSKAVSGSQTAYIQNSKIDKNRILIQNLTEEWNDYKYTLVVDNTGYLGFYIEGGNGIEVKELQIELGNKKTSYEELKYNLQSNYSINLEDKRDEITTNDYYIKIYEDNNLVQTNRYKEIPEKNVITNAIKTYEVQLGRQYKVELTIKMKEREYVLSKLEYNTQETEEIKGIYNKENFLEIQPKGHYMVLGDIDLTGATGDQYRFGSGNLTFEGTIDFNGHTLTRDEKNTTTQIIYYVGENAVIENLVFEIRINKEIEGSARGFCYYNYGTIKNAYIKILECTNLPHRDLYLFCQENSGSIENFVVNLQVPIYLQRALNLITYFNTGTIKNGYVYGENIKAIYPQSTGIGRDIGIIAMLNQSQGEIKNIYNLVNIELDAPQTSYDSISNILMTAEHQSTLENVYSVGTGDMTGMLRGPNVYNTNSKTNNSYYFSDIVFNISDDMKTTPLALYDSAFQNQVLNEDNSFDVDELVEQGYYPHIKWPDCMPIQDYVSLPEVEDKDLPDLLSTTVVEQGTESAKVKFVINNPNAETITNIVIQNLNCTIESQEYKDGKSEVIATLDNPLICTSNYSLEKISTKGAFNAEYSRTYVQNERIVPIELYREIHMIDDWKGIQKSPTENYILMEDLDFRNEGNSIYINGTYSGKFNGNNHTIRNIITNSASAALMWSLSGTFSNLNVENYINRYMAKGGGYYTGLIAVVHRTGVIDNVHVKNLDIEIEGKANYYMVGGIIGNTNSSKIQNCSVSNMKVNSTVEAGDLDVGGIVGNNNGSIMQNSYAQNIEFNVYNSAIAWVGGLAGNGNKIYSSYATGNIYTDANYVGGIAANSEALQNCYSKVNIESSNRLIGGIVGHAQSATGNIKNNLSLGNLYLKSNDDSVFRISDNTSTGNYAYKYQKINGFIQDNDEQIILLDEEELKQENTYINQIQLGASYDFRQVKDGILPKLYNTNGIDLLPNQIDNTIIENTNLQVNDIQYEKTNSTSAEIRIEVGNPNNFEITNIEIEDMKINITDIRSSNGTTYIMLIGTPERYYDSYKLESIKYKDQDNEKTEEVHAKIELQFFKELYSYNDWQDIEDGTYQNYRLMQDIDFAGRNNVKTNVTVGRLESEGYEIKNMNVNFSSTSEGIIGSITLSLQGVTFDNINIENNNSASYVGVIINNTAKVNNITFKNIKILAPQSSYVGMIANNSSNEVSNINLNEINITGKEYIGGLTPRLSGLEINKIYADEITIQATGNNIGGIVGENASGKIDDIKATDVDVSGNNQVGGVVGFCQYGNEKTDNIEINNAVINGNDVIGGIVGSLRNAANNLTAININVSGNNQVGGLIGKKNGIVNYSKIQDSTVSGINQVGGIVGCSERGDHIVVYVKNSDIYSKGENCGGIAGYNYWGSAIQYAVVEKGHIEGNKYVGGIVGSIIFDSSIYQSYVNATIIGNEAIGGIIGHLDNEGMTAVNKVSRIYHTYISSNKIKGKLKVGGIVGDITTDLYMPENFYYSNYVQADIESENSSSISLGIGGRPDQNQYLKDTYYYKYSSINGENPNEKNEIFILSDKYLVENEVKQQSIYTSKLKWNTSNWNFNVLNENKYPTLKVDYLLEQEGIDLPIDSEHIIGKTADEKILEDIQNKENEEKTEQIFEYLDKEIQTYSTYSLITAEDGSKITRNAKLYVKDNNLYVIPSTLGNSKNSDEAIVPVANNLIVDNYNGKEYETVLGSDGKLYDLKEPIAYPENFINEGIESIGNNLENDSHELEVTYKDGDRIKFNYQTGEVISSSKNEDTGKIVIFDYLKTKISEIGKSNSNVSKEITNKYEESKVLQNKLEEMPVEEVIEKQNLGKSEQTENVGDNFVNVDDILTNEANKNNATNNSLQEQKYISIYNPEKGEYQIYNEEELLDTSKQEVVSENDKIEANNLKEYYASEGDAKNTKMGIVWIVLSIIGVVIILFVIKKRD